MEQLALPFVSLSLGRLLAIDDQEAIQLGMLARQAGAVFEQFATAAQHQLVVDSGVELVARLAAIVAAQRARGQASPLARPAASQAGTSEQEQLGAAVLLFGAGFDSPASMVGLGTRPLIEHPGQARLVTEQPGWPPGGG